MSSAPDQLVATWRDSLVAPKFGSLAQLSPHNKLLGLVILILAIVAIQAVYNVHFHPLSKFPGPIYAACSNLPFVINQCRGEHIPWLDSLHAKYGDVVRVGPSKLSFIDGQAWKDIYSHKTGGKKNFPKDAHIYGPDPNGHFNLLTVPSDAEHSRLRRIFAVAFSDRGLKAAAPLLSRYVDQLVGNIRRDIEVKPEMKFDMVKLYNFTTFDIMAELAFGEPLGLLANSEYSAWVANIFGSLKANSFFQIGLEWPWLGKVIQMAAPPSLKQASKIHFQHAIDRVDRRLARNTDQPDIWNLVLNQPEGKQVEVNDMYTNASLFMIAGSETTATLLSGATYLLLRNQDKLSRLVNEIRALESKDDLTAQNLATLPYLTAVLNESLRCYPPVPVGVWRQVPEGGGAIAGQWVPAKTRVSVPQYSAYHSSRNFNNPDAFVPERWLPGPEYEPNTKDVVQPFSLGPRNCIGMNLAWHEMRLILATILWNFDLYLCPESEAWLNQKTYILWEKHPLMVKIKAVR